MLCGFRAKLKFLPFFFSFFSSLEVAFVVHVQLLTIVIQNTVMLPISFNIISISVVLKSLPKNVNWPFVALCCNYEWLMITCAKAVILQKQNIFCIFIFGGVCSCLLVRQFEEKTTSDDIILKNYKH